MEWLFAACIGVLIGCGVFLVLRARSFSVVLGLLLLSYGTNLFIFAANRLRVAGAPVLHQGTAVEAMADPLPQALVLTAIVISFAMTAFVLVLALRALADMGSDRVDGQRGEEER